MNVGAHSFHFGLNKHFHSISNLTWSLDLSHGHSHPGQLPFVNVREHTFFTTTNKKTIYIALQ